MSKRGPTSRGPRIGTWNVRYFPDGDEPEGPDKNGGTDVGWLACAIAMLDVDVLSVQEIKTTKRSQEKQQELIQNLNQRTGGNWQIKLASCQPENVQHPGFLFDANRVKATQFREIPVLSPEAVCSNYVSPGFGAYFEIQGGPDFHFIAVHFAAGESASAKDDRAYSMSTFHQVMEDALALVPDQDIVFAGDFNTSGCDKCEPVVPSEQEIEASAAALSSTTPPLHLVPASEVCSRQDDTGSFLLDHFAIAKSMKEAPSGCVAKVSGMCELMDCGRLREWYEPARERLSDHCPVTLDLTAANDD